MPNNTLPANLSSSTIDELNALALFDSLQSPANLSLLSSELCREIIAATNAEMLAQGVVWLDYHNPSGLQLWQVSINSLGSGSLSVNFTISPCNGAPGCNSISPSSAAHYFFESLMDDGSVEAALNDPRQYPVLSATLWPDSTPTATTSGNFGMSSPLLQISVQPTSYSPGQAPPSTDTHDSGSSSRLSAGAIGGIVIGAVIAVLVCCGLVLFTVWWQSQSESKRMKGSEHDGGTNANGAPVRPLRLSTVQADDTSAAVIPTAGKWSGQQLMSPPARTMPSTVSVYKSRWPQSADEHKSEQLQQQQRQTDDTHTHSHNHHDECHGPGNGIKCDAPSLHTVATTRPSMKLTYEPVTTASLESPTSANLSPIELVNH